MERMIREQLDDEKLARKAMQSLAAYICAQLVGAGFLGHNWVSGGAIVSSDLMLEG